ncbi:hypothetical protein AMTRI_Chr09g37020 [Amborella trichopoda]
MAPTLLSDILTQNFSVPQRYIRPVCDRANLTQVHYAECPVSSIDLQSLQGPHRTLILNQIAHACQNDGLFQVVNHGIPEGVIENMMQVSRDFFRLPEFEKMKNFSDDPSKTMRLSTSFNMKRESVHNWRDYLRLHCYPLQDFTDEWPSNPTSFRGCVSEYCTMVRGLVLRLLEAISESLGLEGDYIEKALGKQGQHMAINYYPPCPEPELTYGLPGHTDPNALTILLQDQVPGLQVLKDGKWVAVDPIPNSFVVNVGDQIQVISNGRYKSAIHRAVVNNEKERISVPTFYCPSDDAIISPAEKLLDKDHPPIYRSYTYSEYHLKFWDKGLKQENCLDCFTIGK